MAIALNELLDGSRGFVQTQDGEGDSATRRYEVTGTNSEILAGSTVANSAPSSVVLPNLSVVNIDRIEVEAGGRDDRWIATVEYSRNPNQDEDDPENPQPRLFSSSFDTSGGTFRITNSKATDQFPNDAENFWGAINVDQDGVPQGVDVVVPQLRIDRTVAYPRSYVDDAFVDQIADLTGTTNASTFFGRPAGEVLLLGAAGEDSGQAVVNISYSFLIDKEVENLSVGQVDNVIKPGHDYIWSRYVSRDGPQGKDRIAEVKAVYVERIYDREDFSILGIPGAE